MGTEKTHYQVLGVSAGASIDEIRRAYRTFVFEKEKGVREESVKFLSPLQIRAISCPISTRK